MPFKITSLLCYTKKLNSSRLDLENKCVGKHFFHFLRFLFLFLKKKPFKLRAPSRKLTVYLHLPCHYHLSCLCASCEGMAFVTFVFGAILFLTLLLPRINTRPPSKGLLNSFFLPYFSLLIPFFLFFFLVIEGLDFQ